MFFFISHSEDICPELNDFSADELEFGFLSAWLFSLQSIFTFSTLTNASSERRA